MLPYASSLPLQIHLAVFGKGQAIEQRSCRLLQLAAEAAELPYPYPALGVRPPSQQEKFGFDQVPAELMNLTLTSDAGPAAGHVTVDARPPASVPSTHPRAGLRHQQVSVSLLPSSSCQGQGMASSDCLRLSVGIETSACIPQPGEPHACRPS